MPAMIFTPPFIDGQTKTQPNGKTYRYNAAKARWEALTQATILPGMVPLETVEITSGNSAIIPLDVANYIGFEVHVHKVRSVTNAVHLGIRTSADGGANFANQAGDYAEAIVGAQSNPLGAFGVADISTAEIACISNIDSTGSNAGGILRVVNPSTPASVTMFVTEGFQTRAINTVSVVSISGGHRRALEVNDAIALFLSSGNFLYIQYTLYGIRGA